MNGKLRLIPLSVLISVRATQPLEEGTPWVVGHQQEKATFVCAVPKVLHNKRAGSGNFAKDLDLLHQLLLCLLPSLDNFDGNRVPLRAAEKHLQREKSLFH